jgi:HEAT repeat protein
MDLLRIKTWLHSQDPQDRMRAITALRSFDQAIAVPLLLERAQDTEVMIRSFVAMGLGHKRNPTAFDQLLTLIQYDPDPNVRAEAANSLAKYGETALPHLVKAFHQNRYWIVRLSILPILADLQHSSQACPDELLEICLDGLSDADLTVRAAAIEAMGELVGTPYESATLQELLPLLKAESWIVRKQLALTLREFDHPEAAIALQALRQDPDHRVIAATLEGLL